MKNVIEIAKTAKTASIQMMSLTTKIKNDVLEAIVHNLSTKIPEIMSANELDLEAAQKLLDKGEINKPTFDRLKLDNNKIRDMIKGVLDVKDLEDPVNKVFWRKQLDEGLILTKISCPIGVIGVIFEARPDVIVQISSLAIKSGNCVILKGGSEAQNTNETLFKIIKETIAQFKDFPQNVINLIFSREDVNQMLEADKYINLIIPRGSNKLVKYIQENTKIPVLGHSSGICHIFADKTAHYDTALKIIIDSKTQYPSACNSVETLLVHKDFKHLKELKDDLTKAGIEIVEKPQNWSIEYGDKILSFKEVSSLDEAIEHINKMGSGHTDCIITDDRVRAKIFAQNVDSAGVFHNVSTRFSDGFRYGFGAEVGISTNKTHARGPVGLDGLTTYKYLLQGEGQIVDDYTSGRKQFKHKIIQNFQS